MADCGDLLTNQDLSNAKKDATTISEFVESNNQTTTSKEGKVIRTLQGANNDAQDAIDSFKLKSKGQYLPDPITLNDGFEYVVYLDKTYFAVSPPYTTDPVTYPTPDLDTVNLIEQSYLTRSFGEKIAGDGDSQLAGGNIWPLSSQDSAQNGDSVTSVSFLRVSGTLYALLKNDKSGQTEFTGTLANLNLISKPYSVDIGAETAYLLNPKFFNGETPTFKSFWAEGTATGVAGDVDDFPSIEAAFSVTPNFGRCFAETGRYAVSQKPTFTGERVTLDGAGKFATEIIPKDNFDRVTYDALVEIGDGTANAKNITVKNIAIQAVYDDFGNDLSGCALNVDFNLDVINCQFKSGNPVTRDTGGALLRRGKHTRFYECNFHNGFGYGAIVDQHNVDLMFNEGCAFDETPSAIVSRGNILQMTVTGVSFGNCVANPTNPTPADGITIDLRVGNHGIIDIGGQCKMTGSSFNKYGVRATSVSYLKVTDNEMNNFARFAIASETNNSQNFSDNSFNGNGTEGASSDPSTGTNDPETTPFTTDIFQLRAEVGQSRVSGNRTDIDTKPMAWIRGDASLPFTTKLKVFGNSYDTYIHGGTYSHLRSFSNGYQDLQTLTNQTFNIAGFTIASGAEESSNLNIQGAEPGDLVVINADDGALSPFLTLRASVTASNIVRYYITNPSAGSVNQAAFDVTVQVIKA